MTYLDAKSELQNEPPRVSFKLLATEAAVMLIIAASLVQLVAQ